ncbi:MAG: hydrogenase 3 maturation endopeptidase HyCI [Clostridiaceae bacterium]|nr:hydrogenase 3 maturation endopeptidase HyCI [Eubacteriales bacterium]
MDDLKKQLRDFLSGAERLAVLGAGSTLRGDDAAGMVLIEYLTERFGAKENMRCYPGETAPENYSGSIRRFAPTHLLVVDAADMGFPSGEVFPIDPNDVGGLSCCTHMLPLKVMLTYLAEEIGAKLLLLGIQPESMEFEAPLTAKAEAAVNALYEAVAEAAGELK